MSTQAWLALIAFGGMVLFINEFSPRAAFAVAGALAVFTVVTHGDQIVKLFGG